MRSCTNRARGRHLAALEKCLRKSRLTLELPHFFRGARRLADRDRHTVIRVIDGIGEQTRKRHAAAQCAARKPQRRAPSGHGAGNGVRREAAAKRNAVPDAVIAIPVDRRARGRGAARVDGARLLCPERGSARSCRRRSNSCADRRRRSSRPRRSSLRARCRLRAAPRARIAPRARAARRPCRAGRVWKSTSFSLKENAIVRFCPPGKRNAPRVSDHDRVEARGRFGLDHDFHRDLSEDLLRLTSFISG